MKVFSTIFVSISVLLFISSASAIENRIDAELADIQCVLDHIELEIIEDSFRQSTPIKAPQKKAKNPTRPHVCGSKNYDLGNRGCQLIKVCNKCCDSAKAQGASDSWVKECKSSCRNYGTML